MALRVENQEQNYDLGLTESVASELARFDAAAKARAQLIATPAVQRGPVQQGPVQPSPNAMKHIGQVPNNGGLDPGPNADPSDCITAGLGVALSVAQIAAAIAAVFGKAHQHPGHGGNPSGGGSTPPSPPTDGGSQPPPVQPGPQPPPPPPTLPPPPPGQNAGSKPTTGNKPATGALPGSGASFQLTKYDGLGAKKQPILAALANEGATPDERDLVLAVAMQETTHLDISMRDGAKDGSKAQNASIFNLNADLLHKLGYNGDPKALNDPSKLQTVVGYMIKGIRQWGPTPFLNYVRGGETGFKDGKSYDCSGYCKAIGTIMQQLRQDPSLLTDDRRVEINVGHQ